ncbi:nucleobindin-2 isoform X1 [Octopus sinensis]|uniref:Nucleobindin-2 isoform X1 n=1 Tax=Octopus sinensis TaxID=2607531 RepID=A0A6P7SDG7_9MOLL|nr:nucleobindin-2 isoform X1 [Octopus sinensis]XP_029636027.1 nucleobindin-2 isoform X1 [Octopus sinensis]
MYITILVSLVLLVINGIVCPPVKPGTKPKEGASVNDTNETGLAYDRYLNEIVNVLEDDPAFKKKLETSDLQYIKSGAISKDLDLVHLGIRKKLDEIKRREVIRLKSLVQEQFKYKSEERNGRKVALHHVNLDNPHSFEKEDLAKLIKQATHDLDELDRERKEDFKQYEMKKEHEIKQKLANLNETQRNIEVQHIKEMKEKHKQHPKIHHPGSKAQLEEVWEEVDRLNGENFNPKTFFKLHDVNGDGVLEPSEVEALFTREIEKMYDPNNPEDDMKEAKEEINRMREHVFKEADTDDNHLLDEKEFERLTQREEFGKDEGWKGLDEDDEIYSEEEMQQYEKMLREEEERLKKQQIYDNLAQPGQVVQPVDPNVVHMQQPHQEQQQQQQQHQEQQNLQYAHQENLRQQQLAAAQHQQQFAQQQAALHQQQQQQPVGHQQQQPVGYQQQQPVGHQQQPVGHQQQQQPVVQQHQQQQPVVQQQQHQPVVQQHQ